MKGVKFILTCSCDCPPGHRSDHTR